MPYCLPSDITDLYSHRLEYIAELSGDPAGQSVDTAKIQSAIDAVSRDMDSFIKLAYSDLSVVASNALLKDIAIEYTVLQLVKWTPQGLDELQRKSLVDIKAQLRDIASGRIQLLDNVESDGQTTFFSSEARVFTRANRCV